MRIKALRRARADDLRLTEHSASQSAHLSSSLTAAQGDKSLD